MADAAPLGNVKIRANSSGRFPILVVEAELGELMTLYHETGYDPGRGKPVGEEWLRENAIGRHGFVEITPPQEMPAAALGDYVRRELLGEG